MGEKKKKIFTRAGVQLAIFSKLTNLSTQFGFPSLMNVMSGKERRQSAVNTSPARLRVESLTFQQQRHEGDVRGTQLGHGQSVGPVVA